MVTVRAGSVAGVHISPPSPLLLLWRTSMWWLPFAATVESGSSTPHGRDSLPFSCAMNATPSVSRVVTVRSGSVLAVASSRQVPPDGTTSANRSRVVTVPIGSAADAAVVDAP